MIDINQILLEGKNSWNAIEVPEQLEYRMDTVIKNTEERPDPKWIRELSGHKKNYLKPAMAVTAASFCAFAAAVNTSDTFAAKVDTIPILREVAKVITIRSYEEDRPEMHLSVQQPEVNASDGISKEMAEKVNAEISKHMNDYVETAREDVALYKKAFLQTGGTEEEFYAKNIQVKVTYEIKAVREDSISFVIMGYEDWNASSYQQKFYNLRLPDLSEITLKDLLGDNYIEVADKSIQKQMKQQMKENPDAYYFTKEEGGFSTITEESSFYINQSGNPVITFSKYEIADGTMGMPEFEIQKK